jgi:aromatic amino acid aminotransferase I
MQRKKEIYDICVEFGASNPIVRLRFPHEEHYKKPDIIIVEDDPYYFLQEGPYILPYQRPSVLGGSEPSDEEYLGSLAPSFLA